VKNEQIIRNKLYHGDSLEILKTFPDEYFAMCVTSPPYFGLRTYHVKGEIGQEQTPEEYTENLVNVFREVRRVLRSDGQFWLNLGDSYAGSGKGWTGWNGIGNQEKRQGFREGKPYSSLEIKPKDLMEIPSMVAMALRKDGWWLRSRIGWVKRNSMPSSVKDRPSSATEYVFQLAKSDQYFYDLEATRKPHSAGNQADFEARAKRGTLGWGDRSTAKYQGDYNSAKAKEGRSRDEFHNPSGRQRRDSDSFFESWQGLYEEDDEPLLLVVNPKGNKYVHFACVDSETEAMTMGGWKEQKDLKDGDFIASFDRKLNVLRWQPAVFHRYDYDGEMISIEKRDTSQLMTPNHRCLVKTNMNGKVKEKVITADKLSSHCNLKMYAPWVTNKSESIGVEFAALVGWYITEGYVRSGKTVNIYQSDSANPEHVVTIRGLLKSVGADFKERVYNGEWRGRPSIMITFSITGIIAKKLRDIAPTKHNMTPELANLSGKEACALLNAIIDGDGHKRKDGRQCIIQKNKKDIDLFQMLAIKCGYRTILSKRKGGTYSLFLTKGEWLTLRGTNGATYIPKKVKYQGIVWCPSIGTGFWLARRNGKTFITGNTYPEGLIEPLIKCSTSEFGYCHECGAPFQRVVKKGDPDERWKSECGADSQGEYGGVSEKWLKQDELGKNTYTGFNARWKKTQQNASDVKRRVLEGMSNRNTLGWVPTCGCNIIGYETPDWYPSYICDRYSQRLAQESLLYAYTEYEPARGVVLDPFMGSGTSAVVAIQQGLDYVGIDLNADYCKLAEKRIREMV
jgi:DNA modification methylase